MKTPVLLDLFCGLGGWTSGFMLEGWKCVGVDVEDFSGVYPGEFIRADVLTWEGWKFFPIDYVVASPPCQEFSRWSMPWTRAAVPPVPSLELWDRAKYIAAALSVPLVVENVRGAQQFVGRSVLNCGPFHLWGDVPALVPYFTQKRKADYSGEQISLRSKVPLELSRFIARCAKNGLTDENKNLKSANQIAR